MRRSAFLKSIAAGAAALALPFRTEPLPALAADRSGAHPEITAGPISLESVSVNVIENVTVSGTLDSGGDGFRLLRVP